MARRKHSSTGSIEQLLAAKEIVIHCGSGGVGKTTTAAAAAAMAAVHHGGKVLVLTVDPARRLANALGPGDVRQRRDTSTARGVRRRGGGAARRAVGCDARHEAELGRSGAAARARRRAPAMRSSPTRSTRTSPVASCRATTTSRWSGSTRSTRRAPTTSSSSTRRRPGTPSTSSRPRSAWPTSSRAACSAGSPCPLAAAC